MQRCRLLLLSSVFCALLLSASPSYGRDFLDRLLHPFTHPPTKSSDKASAAHGETVWSGLVIAENAEKPQPTPPELARFEQTLKDLFGYNQFQVIGESRKMLKTGQEDWLAASKHFSLHVDTRGPSDGGYEVNLKLLQRENDEAEKLVLLETDTKLTRRSPLVIKGPQVGGGQLLLVLVVQ
jgi:hypothetical protein